MTRWSPLILAAARKYGVHPDILAAVIQHESGGQEGLTSSAGAKGLTQFMPGTAASYHVNTSPGHAASQIMGAAHYLRDLGINKDPVKALASYAAGPGDVAAGMPYAQAVLGIAKNYQNLSGGSGSVPSSSGAPSAAAKTAGPSGISRDALLQFAMAGGADNASAVQGLASGLKGAQATPATSAPAAPKSTPFTTPGSVPASVQQIVQRANAIDAKHYNYEWGGGHNPGGAPSHGVGHGSGPGIGFDCSGVVSKLFGINPLVASQFESFGQAGRGKYVTVYANGTHTFLEVNGHFFGTSGSNPGGGAGWIPKGVISASYLAGFVARHPQGL